MVHDCMKIIRDEHAVLVTMLRSLGQWLEKGPGNEPENFFDGLRAMLFYIDEFPERLHHPKESELLFPRVLALAPALSETVERLEKDHANSEAAVRELQHLLLAWELVGESRRPAFELAARRYVAFYLAHMQLEETVILPTAERVLGDADWQLLDAAFAANSDPLTGKYPPDPLYDRLFTRIMKHGPGMWQA